MSLRWLLLVPTPAERRLLERRISPPAGTVSACCGFGPVAAAARTAQLLAEHRPGGVILAGLGGTYDPARLPVGTAVELGRISLHGVGAGEGDALLPPREMGLPPWPADEEAALDPLRDTLELDGKGGVTGLTVCAASRNPADASRRRARWPRAAVEEMEGFAVALAAGLAGIPVRVVRGLANVAGERQGGSWRVEGAMDATAGCLAELWEQAGDPQA